VAGEFGRFSKAAAWLQLPYLLWVTLAGYLNLYIWTANPGG
jgi:tryptophan-rich sensory protein